MNRFYHLFGLRDGEQQFRIAQELIEYLALQVFRDLLKLLLTHLLVNLQVGLAVHLFLLVLRGVRLTDVFRLVILRCSGVVDGVAFL